MGFDWGSATLGASRGLTRAIDTYQGIKALTESLREKEEQRRLRKEADARAKRAAEREEDEHQVTMERGGYAPTVDVQALGANLSESPYGLFGMIGDATQAALSAAGGQGRRYVKVRPSFEEKKADELNQRYLDIAKDRTASAEAIAAMRDQTARDIADERARSAEAIARERAENARTLAQIRAGASGAKTAEERAIERATRRQEFAAKRFDSTVKGEPKPTDDDIIGTTADGSPIYSPTFNAKVMGYKTKRAADSTAAVRADQSLGVLLGEDEDKALPASAGGAETMGATDYAAMNDALQQVAVRVQRILIHPRATPEQKAAARAELARQQKEIVSRFTQGR